MSRAERLAFALVLLAVAFTASIDARRSFSRGYSRPSHSYPSSHGHSGSNSHHYPSSGGLSGSGSRGSHSYPPSGGLSGSNSHGYPSSGGHQPHTPTHVSNVHGTPGQANGHSYPSSTGLSGNNRGTAGGGSNVHYHQHVYQAPQQIHYTPVHGAAPMQPYPVYHGQPPVYIHEIRDSGSRYSTLLTGLALYNLGRSTSGSHHNYQTQNQPSSDNGERCTLRIEQDRNLEKVKIPCYIVSTFKDTSNLNSALSTTTTTSTAAPVSSAVPETTVAPATTTTAPMFNSTALNATTADNVTSAVNATGQVNVTLTANTNNSTVTIQNVTVPQNTSSTSQNVPVRNGSEPVDAVKVKGEPLQLSKEARCFVETVTRTRTSVKEIECGLLQQYALQSMQRQQQPRRANSASNVMGSAFTLLAVTVLKYIVY